MKHQSINDQGEKPLRVTVLDTIADLERIRPAWEQLEERDLEATIFLRWSWLIQAFRANPFRWSVLVVHEADDPGHALCILPLKYRTHWSRSKKEFHTELEAGGRLIWSEYTGFLCDPKSEIPALRAVARHIAKMPWVRLSMRYVAQERRARIFTDIMAEIGFDVRFKEYRINKKQTNNLVCPQVDLPEAFEAFMAEQISVSRRQKYRRSKRKLLDSGLCRIEHTTAQNFEANRDILLDLWIERWREEKGTERANRIAGNYRQALTAAHHVDALFLPVLYAQDRPVGALGHILDDMNGIVHFIVAGRSPAAKEEGIGPLLHFHSIQWAIDSGYICYDFCHGDEPYKYSYGAQDSEAVYFDIRRSDYDPDFVFDSICSGEALKRTETFLKEGKSDEAMRAVAQMSKLLS